MLGGVNHEEVDRLFSKTSFDLIGWRITQGEYVSGNELASAIGANPHAALPDHIRNYLCRFLLGKVKKKRGPKKNYSLGREVIMITAALAYEKELRRLQAERKTQGRIFRGQAAPHERAAEAVQKQFKLFESVTPRRLANILSSRNYRR